MILKDHLHAFGDGHAPHIVEMCHVINEEEEEEDKKDNIDNLPERDEVKTKERNRLKTKRE